MNSLYHHMINNIIHQFIINNQKYTVNHNLCGNPNGRKPHNDFLYLYQEYMHRKNWLLNYSKPTQRRNQPPDLQEPTWRNIQIIVFSELQPKGGYDPLIYRFQPEISSNSPFSLDPIVRRLQPMFLASYFHP